VAALEILKTGEVQRELNRLGDRVREGMNQVLKTRGVPGVVYGASSVFRIHLGADAAELGLTNYTADTARLDRGMGPLGGALHLAMLLNGVDYSRGAQHGWLNGAMTDKDVDLMVDAFDSSIARLRDEKRLG
jgi:glutamate-1-semialdehyde aminotransferase